MVDKYCPYCSTLLVENAKFCSNCGKPALPVEEQTDFSTPIPMQKDSQASAEKTLDQANVHTLSNFAEEI